jgi:hypothetical protein
MLRKSWIAFAALAAGVTFSVASASAVEFGQPDNNRHPWVGLVVFFDAAGAPIQRCSGSLLSPTTFLTAGHCAGADATAGSPAPTSARIWFDEGPLAFDPAYTGGSCEVGGPYTGFPCAGEDASGTPVAHPGWSGTVTPPQSSDVGVVKITSSSGLPTSYGTLAPVSFLDGLATKRGQQSTSFTIVGYGLQSVKPVVSGTIRRTVGSVNLVSLRNAITSGWNLELSGNPGGGNGAGAICYGDSGGPVLYDTGAGEVIVGVASFVKSKNCTGPAVAYRVDTGYAQSFIAGA